VLFPVTSFNHVRSDQQKDRNMRLPVIFVSHGPPMLATAATEVTACWRNIASQIERPAAIVCISAHFEAVTPLITSNAHPPTIHDFGGPAELFKLTYPCPGAPALAERILQQLAKAGMAPRLEPTRGLDHGAWVPLLHMYPQADIPTVQISIQTAKDARHHFKLGRALQALRDEKVLILASGGAVHNLEMISEFEASSPPPAFALEFDDWLASTIKQGYSESLINYEKTGPSAHRCHPWPAEHFLPLLVAQGAAGDNTPGSRIHGRFMFGVLSMAAYTWK
jgi:4,5-DOPA dioxygenase extradiol